MPSVEPDTPVALPTKCVVRNWDAASIELLTIVTGTALLVPAAVVAESVWVPGGALATPKALAFVELETFTEVISRPVPDGETPVAPGTRLVPVRANVPLAPCGTDDGFTELRVGTVLP